MPYAVLLTEDAEEDLIDIYEYVAERDLPGKAEHVLGRIERVLEDLSRTPERGAYPKELLALGIREYHEVLFKPYRIIYRTVGKTVYVLVIVDGRRDMQTLLQRRLLGA